MSAADPSVLLPAFLPIVHESPVQHARASHREPDALGTGTCGSLKVFAEDDATGGIVEYYDDKNQLVGVKDSRQKPCGTYGDIPSCKPDIKWGPPQGGGLGNLKK